MGDGLARVKFRIANLEARLANEKQERDRLIRIALRSGLSQRAVAREAGISHIRVHQIARSADG